MKENILTAIDANFNRAMEGLRVCEDALRFIVHSPLSVKFKELRHRLNSLMKAFPAEGLLGARDVAGDAQKFVDLSTEMRRDGLRDLVRANMHRAIEAVRCIEEYAKLGGTWSGGFQEIRFTLYELEKEIILTLTGEEKTALFRNSLYAILDDTFVKREDLAGTCRRLIAGGASIIQLRMKKAARGEVYEAAMELRPVCRGEGRLFIINDYPDIAEAVDADGVHLGRDDIPVSAARKILSHRRIIGVSTHSVAQAREAESTGPDYIAIGPVFDTASKHGELIRGIGTGVVREVAAGAKVPLVCIGGIDAGNVAETAAAGCTCPAVISALYKGDSIEDNCRAILEAMGRP